MENNESLEKLLDSVQRIDNENMKSEEVFCDIAANLFKHYVIKKGNDTYRFLEIEFYYHSDKHPDDFVYKRNSSVPGCFLIHSSGVDICFRNMGDQTYGGILLRHLLRIDENQHESIVAGPWDCCDAIFNYSDKYAYPYLAEANNAFDTKNLRCTYRFNARGNMTDKNYCFYDNGYRLININDWGEKDIAFLRYNPTFKIEQKNTYSSKPWNRK